MIRLHPEWPAGFTPPTQLITQWSPALRSYKVSARRIPRGHVVEVDVELCRQSGDGVRELCRDYYMGRRWMPVGLDGWRGRGVYHTREEAVQALLSHQGPKQ